MRHLWQQGFGAESTLRICQPIAYIDDWRLMLMHHAKGVSLEQMLNAHHTSFPPAVNQAGQWLARLHHAAIPASRAQSVQDEAESLRERLEKTVKRLKVKHPALEKRAQWVADEIIQRVRSVDSNSLTLTHGDYLMKNILTNGSVLTVIDLGRMCLFDPARDVGKFIGHLIVKAWKYGADFESEKLREHFLTGYASEYSNEFSQRIAAYETRSYLRRSRKEDDPESASFWLRRAEKTLNA